MMTPLFWILIILLVLAIIYYFFIKPSLSSTKPPFPNQNNNFSPTPSTSSSSSSSSSSFVTIYNETLEEFLANYPISVKSTSTTSFGYGTYGSGFVKFSVSGSGMTIQTDGDPFPVPAGTSFLSNTYNRAQPTSDPRAGYGGGGLVGQNQSWTYPVPTYYGGVPLDSLPTAGEGVSMYGLGTYGVSCKGVVLWTPYAISLVSYPYSNSCSGSGPKYQEVNPAPLIVNPVYFAFRYLVDSSGGHPTGPSTRMDNYQYHYHDAMFLYMFTLKDSVNNIPQAPTLTKNSVMIGPLIYPLISPYPNFTPNYNVNTLSSYFKNTYYTDTDGTVDNFRHPDGHSKIMGFSLDGYPIYGPYGYNNNVTTSSGYTFSPTVNTTLNPAVVIMQSSYEQYNLHSFYKSFFTSSSTVYSVSSSSSSSSTTTSGSSVTVGTGGPPPTSGTTTEGTPPIGGTGGPPPTSGGTTTGGAPTSGGTTTYTSYIPVSSGVYYSVTNNQAFAPTTTVSSLPSGSVSRVALTYTDVSDLNSATYTLGPTGCKDSSYQYKLFASKSSSSTLYYAEADGATIKMTGMTATLVSTPMGSIAQDYFYDWNLPLQNTATPNAPFFLDQYNGKFGPTPEYPNGTYAYYLTFTYPFTFAPSTRNSFSSGQTMPVATTTYLS
jgi:hypothetical protein